MNKLFIIHFVSSGNIFVHPMRSCPENAKGSQKSLKVSFALPKHVWLRCRSPRNKALQNSAQYAPTQYHFLPAMPRPD